MPATQKSDLPGRKGSPLTCSQILKKKLLNLKLYPTIDFHRHKADEPKFKQAMRRRNPKNRLRKILDACKNKTKCEGGDEIDVQGQDSDELVKKKRSGCGAQQPKIYIDGMKMIAEYKLQKKKSDDQEQLRELVEQKQLTVEKVLSVLKRISDEDC